MLKLADEAATPETEFFIFPETALPGNLNEDGIERSQPYIRWQQFLAKHPQARVLTGLSTVKVYTSAENLPHTARASHRQDNVWYDAFNAGWHLESNGHHDIYHKSKLVLGVEKMPFSNLEILKSLALDFGGTTGELGTQPERVAYTSSMNPESPKIAPVICYESVYGEYVNGYTEKGAELLFVITNDAWWDNSPGHKQHLSFSRLRAIEQRRSVARSANTGISCFINQRGDVEQATKYDEPIAIRGTINANSETTFYARHGDFLSRIAVFFSILLSIWVLIKPFSKNK